VSAGAPLRTAWRIVGWLGVALLLWLSLTPSPPQVADVPHLDKLQHALAYALLMLWFAQLNAEPGARTMTAAALLTLGIAIEFLQGWGGAREFSVADMAADLVGIGLGWTAAPPRGPDLLALAQRVLVRSL
jgi:VanZ family protein